MWDWGSSGMVLNNLVIVAAAYDISGRPRYHGAVMEGSGLHVGRNALDISYVTGYGEVSAQNQHSRWYASWIPRCPTRRAERWPAARTRPGRTLFRSRSWPALGQFCYIDDIQSWSTNELTINWNAPLAWIASWIADQDEG
jgi:endoglucanase